MDRVRKAAYVAKKMNQYRSGDITLSELITAACEYFDVCSRVELSSADLQFLHHIADFVGLPQYFDMLRKSNEGNVLEDYSLQSISDVMYEASLFTSDSIMLHRYQKEVYDQFEVGVQNRYFLSASTSFGKTYLVYEIIKKMQYSNVLLVFPTIALLSENLERILLDEGFSYFKEEYDIRTTSDTLEDDRNYLCILTPERYLSFIDKNDGFEFDFSFVDEVYKIDNEFVLDEKLVENERDTAYRLAMHHIMEYDTDVLLVGPYIPIPPTGHTQGSFLKFIEKNDVNILNYNALDIVNKGYYVVPNSRRQLLALPEVDPIKFTVDSKGGKLAMLCDHILSHNENAIVYCRARHYTYKYAKDLMDGLGQQLTDAMPENTEFRSFCHHLESRFSDDWVLLKALRKGIGIHNGLIPKYIQKEIVNLFNQGIIRFMTSTTTITEGVNTSAKNLVVMDSMKGDKDLKTFDAKNIAGRAGRFMQHFSGNVFVIKNDFMEKLNAPEELLKHKNFEIETPKGEIDVFITDEEYLNVVDRKLAEKINEEQEERNLPDEVMGQFKVVSKREKMAVYDQIVDLSIAELDDIKRCIACFASRGKVARVGFQIVIDCLRPIVKDGNLSFLFEKKEGDSFSRIIGLLNAYLINGMHGMIDYKVGKGESIDNAVKETSDLVYNTFKYKMVKYLGVFDIMYRYRISNLYDEDMNEVPGFAGLLKRLEYNARTDEGRYVSDYGVPQHVLDYYEGSTRIMLDSYEDMVYKKIKQLFG